VAYADVFDYPLRAAEVHQFLHGIAATFADTATALEQSVAADGTLSCQEGLYTLRGREDLVQLRRSRAAHAARLWPAAAWYGRLMAGLPFVRMVAVTGSLAWDNVHGAGDIDYLVITESGRLWLCRWFTAMVARLARRAGVEVCVNYLLSERVLALRERDLYTAYELVRMKPIAGLAVYRKMRALNAWTGTHLPNALETPPTEEAEPPRARSWIARLLLQAAGVGEWVLRSWVGTVFEWLEMRYRVRKIRSRVPEGERTEMLYTTDCYKAHRGVHRRQTLAAFAERIEALSVFAEPTP
jgi:hypothetical protein